MSPKSIRRLRRGMTGLGLATAVAVMLVVVAGNVSAGGKPKPPPEPPPPASPAIVYSVMMNFDPCIRVMDADGSNDALVVQFDGIDWSPTPDWSPDGEQFVFSGVSYTGRIERINLDGTGRTTLSEGSGTPRWSPGPVLGMGEKLAFARRTVGNNRDLFLMDPDGDGTVLDKGLVNLTNTADVSESTSRVAWSPEASRIAAERGDGHLVVYQLGLVDGDVQVVDAIDVTQEAAEAGVSYPAGVSWIDWANTQDKVAVNAGGQIYVLALGPDEYSVDQLTYPDDGLMDKFGVAWAPDDSKVAVAVRIDASGRGQLGTIAGVWTIDVHTKQKTQVLSIPKSWKRMLGAIEWWADPYGLGR
jgi:hypothetical protein